MHEWRAYQLAALVVAGVAVFTLVVMDREPSQDGKIVLRYLHAYPTRLEPKVRALLDRFESAHPSIRVQLERAPGRYYTKVQTMMVGGTAPDLLGFSGKHVQAFAARGTLLNLMPYVRRDRFDLDDYYPVGLADAQMTDDSVHYLPWEGSGSVLYYSKDMFDRAGIPYPNEDWTWEDFRRAAKALTIDTDGDGLPDQAGVAQSVSWWGDTMPWIWSAGGELVSEDRKRCLLDSPEAVRAVQFLVDLQNRDKATTGALGGREEQGLADMFAAGRVAMFVYIAYGIEDIAHAAEKRGMRWDVTLVPKGPKGRVCRYTSSGPVIWSGTKHPDEAWELLKFVHSREFMREIGVAGYFVPARRSVAESPAFLREETPWREEVFIKALKDSRPLPNLPEMGSLQAIFREEVDKAALDQPAVTVEQAMREIARRADAELNRRPLTEYNAAAWAALLAVVAAVAFFARKMLVAGEK